MTSELLPQVTPPDFPYEPLPLPTVKERDLERLKILSRPLGISLDCEDVNGIRLYRASLAGMADGYTEKQIQNFRERFRIGTREHLAYEELRDRLLAMRQQLLEEGLKKAIENHLSSMGSQPIGRRLVLQQDFIKSLGDDLTLLHQEIVYLLQLERLEEKHDAQPNVQLDKALEHISKLSAQLRGAQDRVADYAKRVQRLDDLIVNGELRDGRQLERIKLLEQRELDQAKLILEQEATISSLEEKVKAGESLMDALVTEARSASRLPAGLIQLLKKGLAEVRVEPMSGYYPADAEVRVEPMSGYYPADLVSLHYRNMDKEAMDFFKSLLHP